MNRRNYDFVIERANFGRNISINMAVHYDGIYRDLGSPSKRSVATGITFAEVDPDDSILLDKPLLTLTITDAQALMDELWRCGLRPSEGSGSAGSLAATERHLVDMQKIAFQLLGK